MGQGAGPGVLCVTSSGRAGLLTGAAAREPVLTLTRSGQRRHMTMCPLTPLVMGLTWPATSDGSGKVSRSERGKIL